VSTVGSFYAQPRLMIAISELQASAFPIEHEAENPYGVVSVWSIVSAQPL
jgi:hypothetical protein